MFWITPPAVEAAAIVQPAPGEGEAFAALLLGPSDAAALQVLVGDPAPPLPIPTPYIPGNSEPLDPGTPLPEETGAVDGEGEKVPAARMAPVVVPDASPAARRPAEAQPAPAVPTAAAPIPAAALVPAPTPRPRLPRPVTSPTFRPGPLRVPSWASADPQPTPVPGEYW